MAHLSPGLRGGLAYRLLLLAGPLCALTGCYSGSTAAVSQVCLVAKDIVVPPSLQPGTEPPLYERPEASAIWDLATLTAVDGTPLTGFYIWERSTVDVSGWPTESGYLHIHSHKGTVRVLEVRRGRSLAEAADAPRSTGVHVQPAGYLDRALRDAGLGARVSNEKTTEFCLDFIWVPNDAMSVAPLLLQRVEVRSQIRPGLCLYGDVCQ